MEIVSFEIALKLKEKGFKERCLTYYDVNDNMGLLYNTQYTDDMFPCQYTDLLQSHNTDATIAQADDSEYCVDAPTISQVLKWLREEKKIYIMINFWPAGYSAEIFTEIGKDKYSFCWGEYIDECDYYESYELAALAGVEYVIDNLI